MDLIIGKALSNKNVIVDDTKPIIKELTADGLPTIETQLREIEERDKEDKKTFEEHNDKIYRREMKQRVKCLCLDKMGMSITTNTLNINKKQRAELQRLMWEYNDTPHEDIVREFNEKFSDFLDYIENPSLDISKLPIYQYK